MASIFVSYRRGPHSIAVSALAQRLAHHFGPDVVFVDNQLMLGARYPDELTDQLNACDVLVAVIHDRWLPDLDARRDGHKDWVHHEVAAALTAHKVVLPVLLDQTEPPTHDQLPADIAELAARQMTRVRAMHFAKDVDDLIWHLERHIAPTWQPPVREQRKTPMFKRFLVKAAVGFAASSTVAALFTLAYITVPELRSRFAFWMAFVTPAVLSAVIMILSTLLIAVGFPLDSRLVARALKKEAEPIRRRLSRAWLFISILMIGMIALVWDTTKDLGGSWQFVVGSAAIAVLVYALQRMYIEFDTHERQWPPVIRDPREYRWAVTRLHQRLATEHEWRRPRSRLQQEQAVSAYLDLAEAKLALQTQAALGRRQWLTSEVATMAPFYVGWLVSIAVWQLTAAVSLVHTDHHPRVPLAAAVLTAVVLVPATASTVATWLLEFRADRKLVRQLADDLTEWQARLGPLVFHKDQSG